MEIKVSRSRPKRSFIRRLAAPVASLVLLAGGGWGAYHYYGAELGEAGQGNEPVVAAHSALSAKDELKMLFASDEQATTPQKKSTTPQKRKPKQVDRYAGVKPKPVPLPIAKPTLAPAAKQQASQQTVSQQPALGDRYATALTSLTTPAETPAETEPKKDDVARGQEPNNNPLRTASPPTAPPALDARAAFGAALTQAPKTAAAPVRKQAAPKPSNDLATALQQARPLQASPSQARPMQTSPSKPPAPTNDRYQSAPLPSSAPNMAQTGRPAPPLDIQQPPQRQRPPLRANPLGTPPVALQSRAPANPPLPAASNTALPGRTPTPGLATHPGTGRPGESLLEGAQSPSITIQKLAPEEIQVGKRCTFAIRVHNSGQRTAQRVQIRDEVPLGTELVGTAPRATVSGSEIVWDLGTLSPGEERTVEMELLPKEEGEIGSVAMVSMTAQASAKARCTRPELALRLTSKPQVHVGDRHAELFAFAKSRSIEFACDQDGILNLLHR